MILDRKLMFFPALSAAFLGLAMQAWSQPTAQAEVSTKPLLRPFIARYEARYYGVTGGTIELTLRKGAQPNEYIYESHAKPGLLASFLISDAAHESSSMTADSNGVRPTKFIAEDGKKSTEQDSLYEFDWSAEKLVGNTGNIQLNQALPEHIQDHLSVQIAVIWALQNNLDLGEFTLVDGGKIKSYQYTKEGTGTLAYKGRQLDTTIVRSARSGNLGGRVNRYWHATEFGNIPIRAERSHNGKVDLTLALIDLRFTD
jgi:hypothetical protein